MIAQFRLVMVLAGVALAAACMTAQPLASNTAVGPDPMGSIESTSKGFLTVYSLTKTYPVDEETWYRVHTDYGIYDPSGHRVLSVRNAATYHDPFPKVVALPAGNYTIKAWGDGYALLEVPVVIQSGRMTTVNLEAQGNELFRNAKASDVVRAPDGVIIGWMANAK